MKLRCGLLGEKLGHSYSPALHALYGDYEYRLYECLPEKLADFLSSGDFDALNVTMPYKKAAAACCTELSDAARAVGCVNTIVRRDDGTLCGYNTDLFGFEEMLAHAGLRAEGTEALVLGSGGASATALSVLRRQGARVCVISRGGPDNYDNIARHADAQLLINATPVGMYPGNGVSPVDLTVFPRLEGVVDVIYNPAHTALLMQAEQLGIAHTGGLRMLCAQAKRSSELFTGQRLADDAIGRAERAIAGQMENIILVGMPGCGKTTLARALGAATGREVFDCDALVCELAGMTVEELFTRRGEEGFRTLETEALRRLGKRSGCVIATGGGCVTREENYPLLHQNGRIVWLRRAPDKLAREGRPLSQKGDLAAMYAAREPLYARFADCTVDNDGTVEQTLAQLVKKVTRRF